MSATRFGDWIQTYQGAQMYPLDPCVSEVNIMDIAHSLSNMCRFNGHVVEFYSVAEHCCHVSDILPDELKITGLLHDASEAYLCDLPRPIKRSQGFAPLYLEAEDKLMRCIAERFGFPYPLDKAIHDADNRLLGTEACQLMWPLHPEWRDVYPAVEGLVLPCWSPREAKAQFIERCDALGVAV